MALHALVAAKKIALAQTIITGAFINGALIGAGTAALAYTAAKAAQKSGAFPSRAGRAPASDDPRPGA